VIGMLSTDAFGRRIAAAYPASKQPRLEWLGVDPAGSDMSSSASERGGISDVLAMRDAMTDEGLRGARGVSLRYLRGKGTGHLRSVNTGLEKVRGKLENSRGETSLYFARSLVTGAERGIVEAMQSYEWRRGIQVPLRGQDAGQVDHAQDALRYMLRHQGLRGASVERAA